MKNKSFVYCAVFALCVASPVVADETIHPTARDIAAMSSVSGRTLSPDGTRVAYVRTTRTFDEEAETAEDDNDAGWTIEAQLWVVAIAGGDPTQLTYGDEKVSQPSFSPDGKRLAFKRKQGDRSKIHVLDMRGGEARIVETGKVDSGSFAWSPDGKQFAFLAESPETDEEKDRDWASGGAIRWAERWRTQSLWVVAAEGGEPRRVTPDDLNIVSFVWSPDGTRFLATTTVSADPYYTFSLRTPRLLSVSDGSIVKTLEAKPGGVGELAWSPDGRFVAYERGDGTLSLLNALRVHEADGDQSWNAAGELDPTLRGFFFAADSRSLVAHVIERTDSSLYRLSLDGTKAKMLGRPGRVLSGGLDPSDDRSLFLCTSSTTREPADPTVVTIDGVEARVVARMNPQVDDWNLGHSEVVSWKSPEGPTIEGVLFHSPLTEGEALERLMILPHGGPDSVTTQSFSNWAHYFAARGLSVLRPNYRGGLGYGFDFYAANRGRLGPIEQMDIESGVDHLIAEGIVDADQLYYGGWSWGGYLTAWTIGHTTRYRAAVAGAAVVDTVNQYVTSDINHGVAAEWEYTTMPWGNFGPFDASNPMRFLHQVTTPTLIIHGQSDDRVPFSQGLTLYRALSDSGAEVEMLAYPREPHGFREPAHTEHMLEAWAAWYEAHGLRD